MTLKVLGVTFPGGDTRIHAVQTTGWWLWKRHRNVIYEGSSTVWHDVETGRRPGTVMEGFLSSVEWKAQRERRKS